ncbi:bifunctional DNA primase/polymerase [Blastopirellula sp. JC732]|uniref:Bifunctional DNA primase/polymerase n=1 Tax=Blastopirellula sediminis TaxID=2894196 RepID=A0A9X1MIY8_9BACT|nr:bifunctional DNA primase/polymerase [Blastopirellula sediminis]MCC9627125.1 bifunctional DNA primase/polymerase [Blastopirellula sediminis]
MYRAARAYRDAGLSFIPISRDRKKQPAFDKLPKVWSDSRNKYSRSWAEFKGRQPTLQAIRDWFRSDSPHDAECGLAIVGGRVSGNLEILDLDTFDLVDPFKRLIEKKCPGLLERLIGVKTPRPGLHLYYRCETIGGSQKLARIPASDEASVWKTIIETKGEGGYCLAPPSPKDCHPTQTHYCFETDMDFTKIPTISLAERQLLLDVARSFDKYEPPRAGPVNRLLGTKADVFHSDRPGDDFNSRGDWRTILQQHGWRFAGSGNADAEHWTRPGKSNGCSATTNYEKSGVLYVFSQNAHPFEADKGYSKFHAYALLEHGGDFTAAARDLARQGYGKRPTVLRIPRRSTPAPSRLRRRFR